MRAVTATEKFKAVNKGLMAEAEFVRQMRQLYPMYVSPFNGYKDTVQILKNRGMLFEEKKEKNNVDNHPFSPEALARGIDAELEKAGIDSAGDIDTKDLKKAEKKAIKNLTKDVLYYINLLSGESSKVDKHDKTVETKRGAKDRDTYNGLKKANLKEGAVKNKVYAYAERLINHLGGDAVNLVDSLEADDFTGIGIDYKFFKDQEPAVKRSIDKILTPSNVKIKAILKRGIETIKAKYPSVHIDDILAFIRTHRDDVLAGVDIADEFEEFADNNDVLVKDPKGGLDREPGPEAMSVKDIEALPDEIDPKTGKPVVMFREELSDEDMEAIKKYGKEEEPVKKYELGDMWSTDFDYDGMLQAGLRVRINTPVDQLKKLYASFEDVNYHRENSHMSRIIDAIEDGDKGLALDAIRDYKDEIKLTLDGMSRNEGQESNQVTHDCASHVMHEKYGPGICLHGQHTLKENEDGTGEVTHYNVFFKESGKVAENVPVQELEIITSAHHKHEAKNPWVREDENKIASNSKPTTIREYSDDDDEQEWREEFPEAIKYSWEWDDEGVGSVDHHIDLLFSHGAPDISKEEAMEMMGRPDDETKKAFNQAFITQMQETDDTGGDYDDYQYTINLLYAYEKTYGEPFNTNLIKFLSPYKDAKPKTYDEYKKHVSKLLGKEISERSKNRATKRAINEQKQVKEAVKKVIRNILSEAYTGRLQGYIDNDYGSEVQGAAKDLMGVLEALEADFLKHKDKIAAAYEKAGPGMAPALGNAFIKDLTNQRLSYDKIEMPKFRKLSPDEKAAIDSVREEEKETVYTPPVNEKKNGK